ncbi:MAG TPA: hypothetical protein DCP78_16835, partial [Sphingobacterium sp.]|nr:hypothetical protein [Sphingobacterium sp.]
MSKVDVKSFAQLGKKSKLFFSLAVIAGTFQQVNAAVGTSGNYEGKSFVKEVNHVQQQVKGKVLDAAGKPISGVTSPLKVLQRVHNLMLWVILHWMLNRGM